MVSEGMGYAFALDKLVNTTGSDLCFRPLNPKLELGMYLVWKKSQSFSRAMELFQEQLQKNLAAFRTEATQDHSFRKEASHGNTHSRPV